MCKVWGQWLHRYLREILECCWGWRWSLLSWRRNDFWILSISCAFPHSFLQPFFEAGPGVVSCLLGSLGFLFRESPLSSQQPGQLKPGWWRLLSPFLYLSVSVCTTCYKFAHGVYVSSFWCLFSSNFFAILGNESENSYMLRMESVSFWSLHTVFCSIKNYGMSNV